MTLPLTGAGPSGAGVTAFDPLTLSPTLWLKADAITGKNDGDALASWTDSSGNANTVSQGTGANQPLYKTAIVNGKPVVRFDGTNDLLVAATALVTAAPWTVCMVINPATASGVWFNGRYDFAFLGTSQWRHTTPARADMDSNTTARTNGVFQIVTLVFSAAFTSNFFTNGTAKGSPTSAGDGAAATQTFKLGLSAGGGQLNGDVAEFLLIPSALSAGNRQSLEGSLGTKYGIAVV